MRNRRRGEEWNKSKNTFLVVQSFDGSGIQYAKQLSRSIFFLYKAGQIQGLSNFRKSLQFVPEIAMSDEACINIDTHDSSCAYTNSHNTRKFFIRTLRAHKHSFKNRESSHLYHTHQAAPKSLLPTQGQSSSMFVFGAIFDHVSWPYQSNLPWFASKSYFCESQYLIEKRFEREYICWNKRLYRLDAGQQYYQRFLLRRIWRILKSWFGAHHLRSFAHACS